MATTSFTCVLLGEEPLLAQCGDAAVAQGHRISAVVTTTPHNLRWARERSIPVWSKGALVPQLEAAPPDLLISVTWPWIIPLAALQCARRMAINYHDGPLPRYAGMNGSAWALLRGEQRHAIVWHVMTAGIDEGDILKRRDVLLEPRETSVSLNIKNAGNALASFGELLQELAAGREVRTPQDKAVQRFELSRHDRPERMAVVDVQRPAQEIDALVRACDFGPYPNPFGSAKLLHQGKAVLLDEAEPRPGGSGTPGTVVSVDDDALVLRTGVGALAVLRGRTLGGAPLTPRGVAAALGVGAGEVLQDDSREARARWSRPVAEVEATTLRVLAEIASRDPLDAPLAPPKAGASVGVHTIALDGNASAEQWMAAYAFLVGSLAGRDDVSLALCCADVDADAERVRGLLLPSRPLWLPLDAVQTVQQLVELVRERVTTLRARPSAQFDLVTRHPQLSRFRDGVLAVHAVTLEGQSPPPGAVVTLALQSDATGQRAMLLFDGQRVREQDARAFSQRLERLLARLVRDHAAPLKAVDLLDDDERQRITRGWNDTARPFAQDERIQDAFERQVAARPDALAVVCESRRATFKELDQRANRIANTLVARGAGPGTFVAFCLPRSIDLVATMLAVSKTGAAYVPIDVQYPPERSAFMLDDANALLVITTDKLAERFPKRALLMVDGPEILRASDAAPVCAATATHPCYAIYTSGSTGMPKGVLLTHRAVVNTLQWVSRTFEISERDRLLFVTSPSFDLSVYDVFGALGAGAVVEVASQERLMEPSLLVRRIVEQGVTIWDSAPPALARLVPFLPKHAPDSTLRLVMLSGDWIPVKLPDQLRAVFPHARVKSLGGATEAAIWSNFHDVEAVDPSWTSIPYGRPIDNARYYILDGKMRALPAGTAGDLYIGGACLAQGYLNRAELTRERFLPDPFLPGERIYKTGDLARFWEDGTMEFLGRADFQVKIRGFRVELGEIEVALGALHGVHEAVVVARKDASGDKILVAYVVANDGETLDAAALKKALAARMPDFMVPSFIVPLPRLPITQNGKLDRAALPEPNASGVGETLAPRTPTEQDLLALWQEVLRTRRIGVRDSFFDLGGHSLSAALLVTKIKARFEVEIPLSRVVSHPTIEALAQQIEARRGRGPTDERSLLIPLRERGDRPPLFLVAGIGGHVFGLRDLALRLPEDQPVYAFRAIGAEGSDLPKASVEEIAAVYQREVVEVAKGRPVVIGGYSFGALVAFELARRLRKSGVPIEHVVLLDVFAPGYPKKPALPVRAVLHANHFRKLDGKGKRSYLFDRAKNLARRTLIARGLGAAIAPGFDDLEQGQQDRMRTMWAALAQAQHRYAPGGSDPGPVTLFRSTQNPEWPGVRFNDDTNGWRSWVTGPLDVVPVRGSHLQLFEPDNLDVIGRELTERLRS